MKKLALLSAFLLCFAAFAGRILLVTSTGPTVVFYDTFTDTNGTLLQDHTPAPTNIPGNMWQKTITFATDTFQIQSNNVVCLSGTDPLYLIDLENSSGTFTINLNWDLSDAQVDVFFGQEDANYNTTGSYAIIVTSGGSVTLTKYGTGTVDSETITPSAGVQEWKFVINGGNIVFSIDSVEVLNYTGDPLPGTFWGMEAYHPAGGGPPLTTFQDVKLTVP